MPVRDDPTPDRCVDDGQQHAGRLRTNFCSGAVDGDSRAISVQSQAVMPVFEATDSTPSQVLLKISAAPVLIGLDDEPGCTQLAPISNDRREIRTLHGLPGDGFDMYGGAPTSRAAPAAAMPAWDNYAATKLPAGDRCHRPGPIVAVRPPALTSSSTTVLHIRLSAVSSP
jgi:hypothetical protein